MYKLKIILGTLEKSYSNYKNNLKHYSIKCGDSTISYNYKI